MFPAASLQAPFFDISQDDAANYGAIGVNIAHEISHGFDSMGSQFDGNGVLRNWWTDADRKAFDALGARLVAQFDGCEALPGKHASGKLTLTENMADLSGMQIAFKAWQNTLGGKPSPVIGGRSGEQRFFIAAAHFRRVKMRDEAMLTMLASDPHAPHACRANGPAVNTDGFHDAFGTRAGDAMYRSAAERIRIW
ncbi:M13 family metallopeptidase [Massilia sp. H-1]|nr:M13 family metallopeptidase [Massilia sp. H-1]